MKPGSFVGPAVLAALFVLAVPAAGQGLDIGAEAGINVSDLSVDAAGSDETETSTGLRVGGVLRLDLGPMFGLQTGVYYSEKGATDPGDPDVDTNLELTYVEAPLLVTLEIPTGPSPVSPRFYAGPQVAFESGCDISVVGDGSSVSLSCDEARQQGDFEIDTRSADFSVVVGGGIDLAAGPGAFTVDARYDLGLSDINDFDGGAELTNRNLAFSAGYLISLP